MPIAKNTKRISKSKITYINKTKMKISIVPDSFTGQENLLNLPHFHCEAS